MLGFSIYLNKDVTSETEQYIKRLKKNNFNGIFTSVHIPEEDSEKYKERLLKLGSLAKVNNLNVMVDIDRNSLKKLDISLSSLNYLKKQGITGLRIDDKLASEQIATLSQNIEIGINGSTFTEEELRQLSIFNAKMENIQAWFNFYPCPDTGISRQFFEKQIRMFKKYGMKVQAFFAGDENRRGPLYEGLPTLECQRTYDPLASILKLKELGADLFYLGDPGISDESLDQIRTYQETGSIILYTKKAENVSEKMYNYILGKHNQRPDPAEYVVRCEDSRMHKVPIINSENVIERVKGSITLNNRFYQRYMGEIQLVKGDLPMNKKVNVVGRVDNGSISLIDSIQPGQEFYLYKK
ncbi:MupG family TIM beta-alpha barrel fold protein [Lactobacillus hamsteri]|uniref:Outer surface protein n=1 Tax=Lactobacillus hamsteri DSM 5661 = JCM 6256 TaxID=1423754 RepID=A0A0R1YEU2_9LACO|nr:MupG family TIM beta-alpha barrel fold protein [Lactobacillus hamsteri]KRM40817.1 hypothetical protein FC39_GL000012 [Lactobacillus hamsteri DSM 5661 = JCM 6256]